MGLSDISILVCATVVTPARVWAVNEKVPAMVPIRNR
jgi:hypothetical protein